MSSEDRNSYWVLTQHAYPTGKDQAECEQLLRSLGDVENDSVDPRSTGKNVPSKGVMLGDKEMCDSLANCKLNEKFVLICTKVAPIDDGFFNSTKNCHKDPVDCTDQHANQKNVGAAERHYQPSQVQSASNPHENLTGATTLYVGILSDTVTLDMLEGLAGKVAANVSLIPGDTKEAARSGGVPVPKKFSFFNFANADETAFGKAILERIKAEHVKDKNEDIFVVETFIRFRGPQDSNPQVSNKVLVSSLNDEATQDSLNAFGHSFLAECGFVSVAKIWDGDRGCYNGNFTFSTSEWAGAAYHKLVYQKEKDFCLADLERTIFTPESEISVASASSAN